MATTTARNPLNEFALKLFNKMSAGKNENFFISPFSISTALAMCAAGARGETATQLKELLNVGHLSDAQFLELNQSYLSTVNSSLGDHVKINTANKIYPHEGFQINPDYVNLLTKNFHSEIEQVDYANPNQAAATINSWVEGKTNHKIKNLISPSALDALTRLVLVNAIYFKGDWMTKFRTESTSKEDFHLADGSTKQVDMMKLYNKKFKYLYHPAETDALALELPYIGDTISMTIILPDGGVSLEQVEKQLTSELLHEILTSTVGSTGSPKDPMNLQVPKFKLEYKDELSQHFQQLGATLPFDEQKADFSGITSDPRGLNISKVVHQAVVEVNEEGTEAAAATGVVMMTRMAHVLEPFPFICNRPFLFVIHEKIKNSVLFYGKYTKPQ